MPGRITTLLLGASTALLLPAAGGARHEPPTPAQVIAILQHERAANGLPAHLVENPDWSAKCALHVAYMERNHVLTHEENPSSPGYTPGGAWAGANAVLAQNTSFAARRNPFDDAPLHLAALLNPYLTTVGAADDGRYVCVTITGVRTPAVVATPRGTPQRFYSYPGDGRTNVPVDERADEGPFAPGAKVGLPSGTVTGPYLILYGGATFSYATHVVSASLRSDDGTGVPVRAVEPGQLGDYGYGPVFIIPVSPLSYATRYTATVHLVDPATRSDAVEEFGFTTVRGLKMAAGRPGGGRGATPRVSPPALREPR